MTILDYIATHPGCSGGEIAAALNTPTTAINAELRQLARRLSHQNKPQHRWSRSQNWRTGFLPRKPDAVRV